MSKDAEAALKRGDYFHAYDLASSELKSHPDDLRLNHLALLALARSCANRQARACLEDLKARGLLDQPMEPRLAADLAAIDAKLIKNVALEAEGEERRALATRSAEGYEAALAGADDYYPAINAATMWLVAGNLSRSAVMARRALVVLDALGGEDAADYWALATRAEALLLLGQGEAAAAALATAMEAAATDPAAAAATRRQLRLICDISGMPWSELDRGGAPIVLHYRGHGIGGAATAPDPSCEADVATAIGRFLDSRHVAAGFGSLADDAEILVAEALLARDIDLHLIFPCDVASFRQAFVAERWWPRFDACAAAARQTVVSRGADLDDPLFRHAAMVGMGMALMRADFLATTAEHLAVWDRSPEEDAAATVRDVDEWSRTGNPVTIIPSGRGRAGVAAKAGAIAPRRELKALLFCDIKGFSTVAEPQMPAFIEHVLGGLAKEIAVFDHAIAYRETAGDGIYVVFDDVVAAADCGVALTRRMERLGSVPGLPPLALRVSAHVGVVLPAIDPVTGFRKFFGTEVIRAARIEPITPPGECYVTEELASHLQLAAPDRFNCDYVGVLDSAKGFGAFRMYSLRRRMI